MNPNLIPPEITVITPLYNSSRHIEGTLNSLCKQTYGDWECILIDDGSTDDTSEKVKPFLQDTRFTYIRQANKGIAGARNTGIKAATGKWVCLLDHDDRWHETKLEKQLAFARRHACDIVCTDAVVIQGATRSLYSSLYPADFIDKVVRGANDPSIDIFDLLIQSNYLCASSVMIRKSLFDQLGLLDPHAAPADDYDMWLRCMPGAKIGYLMEPLVEYVLHDLNYSHNKVKMYEKVVYVLSKLRSKHAGDKVHSKMINKTVVMTCRHFFMLCQMERHYGAALSQLLRLLSKGEIRMAKSVTREWAKRWLAGGFRRARIIFAPGERLQ